jgi:hypothetical protein
VNVRSSQWLHAQWPISELSLVNASLWQSLLERQKVLTWFAITMLVCAGAATLVALWDDRLIRGANLWLKPIKFMLSTAAFSLTTAWFMGLLEPHQRQTALMHSMVWVLVITALFEVVYITGAAAMGGESHHNTSTAFGAAMFGLMAVAAVALTTTQAVLAWAIWRNASVTPMPVAAQAVLIGLVLAWALGTASGFLLGGKQPPAFAEGALPLLGWHLGGGDGRPAHFLGLHAHQFLPLLGFILQRYLPHSTGIAILWFSSAGYVGLWWWLVRLALR